MRDKKYYQAMFRKLYEFFKTHGWTKGTYCRDVPGKGRCYCIGGAANELGISWRSLDNGFCTLKPKGFNGNGYVTHWNDSRRSKTQFMLQLRKLAGLT